jgi:hypothetical protein
VSLAWVAAAALVATSANESTPPADEGTASNVVFVEPLGNGLLYSINYERLFERYHLGLRAGASYFSWAVSSYGGSGNLTLVSFPLVASYYVGATRHKLQLGAGATILYLAASSDSEGTKFEGDRAGAGVAATAVIGYRYLPPHGGITFGAGFTPLLRPGRFLPWGGVSGGVVF